MDDWTRAVHGAREVLGDGAQDMPMAAGTVVSPVVYESWKRSRMQGLEPCSVSPGYYPDIELDSHLARVVTPLVEKRMAALEQAMCALSLTDQEGLLIRRWAPDSTIAGRLDAMHVTPGFSVAESHVGTTSAISLLSGSPVLVRGPEHFSQHFHALTCAGAPVVHPVTRRTVGSLDLTCRLSDTSPVLLSWVMELAADVERALLSSASRREQLLLDSYLAHNRDSRHPLVALDQNTIMTNAAAARLLGDVDQAMLWEYASRAMMNRVEALTTVVLTNGSEVVIEARPITDGSEIVGAVLKIKRDSVPRPSRRAAAASRQLAGLVGDSPRWRALCSRAAQVKEARRLLVIGEPGSGRLSVARAIAPPGPLRVMEVLRGADAVDPAGVERWLREVEAEVDGPDEILVLRHIDLLDEPTAQAATAALSRRPSGRMVLATSEVGPFAHDLRNPLLDTFDEMLEVPALNERLDDLPVLLRELTARAVGDGPAVHWMPDAVQALSRLGWSGNVSSVESLVRWLVGRRPAGGYVSARDLPADLVAQASRRPLALLEQAEAHAITRALREAGGNKHRAAESLGIARSTLYRKVRALGLDLSTAAF